MVKDTGADMLGDGVLNMAIVHVEALFWRPYLATVGLMESLETCGKSAHFRGKRAVFCGKMAHLVRLLCAWVRSLHPNNTPQTNDPPADWYYVYVVYVFLYYIYAYLVVFRLFQSFGKTISR